MALTKITTSVVAVNSLTAANIADNSIDATKIANNQILARHIAAGSLTDQLGTLASLTVDDITINGSTISDAADLSIDVGADLTLDAGGGDIILSDDGTIVGTLSLNSSDFEIRSRVSDKDLIFKGKDGSSEITALTLDMSDAGTAIFNNKVGIGTSSPAAGLQVATGLATAGGPAAGTSTASACFGNSGSDDNYGLVLGADGNGRGYIAAQRTDGTATVYDLMLQHTGGNVGIGVPDPDWALDVKGYQSSVQFQLGRSDNSVGTTWMGADSSGFQMGPGTYNTGGFTAGSPALKIKATSGNVGIADADPPSTLTVLGTNSAVVASNGAGIKGIQVTRTTSSGENIYLYCTDGSTTGWSGLGNVGRVESYGNNALEIGSQQDAVVSFGRNNTEIFRLRSDGLQFPDNNTFIATSNVAGGTAYEWGSIRRPASSDGGQLSIRQYSTGDTAANYPAYAGGTSGWDENTGMFFYGTDEVGLTAAGNPTFWVEEGKKWEVYENGFTSGDANRGQRVCLGGISHIASTNPGGTGSGTYLHIKTNVPKSNVMFRFEYKGHGYNDRNIDTSIVGYTYADINYVYTPTIQDTGDTTYNFKTPYYSSDNKLVLVVQIANNYTGGILWAQFVGSHTMSPGSVAIASTAYSSSTSGAF